MHVDLVELMMAYTLTPTLYMYIHLGGYKSSQLFEYKHSKYDAIYLIIREINDHGAYEDVSRTIGVPNKTVTDNE